jgi:DNA helicase-2/ATP-dependent DNA helicase PcrA
VLCKLSELFADDKIGVTLSTVHKAKGLESNTVYILGPELLPAPWAKSSQEQEQERNIKYVATTRAMRTLISVPLPPRRKAV